MAALAVVSLAGSASSASALIRLVTTNADTGGAGSLRGEIASSFDTDVVELTSTGNNPVIDATNGPIPINASITIVGNGVGVSTVSVNTTMPVMRSRAFNVAALETVKIEKLTITGGKAPDGGAPPLPGPNPGVDGEDGGAILNHGDLTLDHVTISGNEAGKGGLGGPSMASSAPTPGGPGGMGGDGGGVASDGIGLTIKDSTVSENLAGDGGPGSPGAIDTDLMNQTGSNGGAGGLGGNGGGVAVTGGALDVTNSTIGPNNLAGDGGNGGSAGNTPPGPAPMGVGTGGGGGDGGDGGGISNQGIATSLNSTLAGNDAGDGGDGSAGSATPTSGGNGGDGGGLAADGGNPVDATHLTISDNSAGASGNGAAAASDGEGGGVVVLSGITKLTNTLLVSNNSMSAGSENCKDLGTINNGGHNISFDGGGCPILFGNQNPMLGPLAPNGGPTKTMAIGSGTDAQDGVPATGANCPATDQRGTSRPQGPACDIGAFEYTIPPAGGGIVVVPTTVAPTPPPAKKKCKKGFKLKRGKCKRKRKK